MTNNENELIQHLKRIELKQDETLTKQDALTKQLNQIHKDSKRTAMISGGIAGGIAGGMVTVGIELIKFKLGG